MIKVTTIDGMDTKINMKLSAIDVIEELNTDKPTVVFSDDLDTVWFVKSHIIRVSIRSN